MRRWWCRLVHLAAVLDGQRCPAAHAWQLVRCESRKQLPSVLNRPVTHSDQPGVLVTSGATAPTENDGLAARLGQRPLPRAGEEPRAPHAARAKGVAQVQLRFLSGPCVPPYAPAGVAPPHCGVRN